MKTKFRQYLAFRILLWGIVVFMSACHYPERTTEVLLPSLSPSQHTLLSLTPKITLQTVGTTLHQQYLRLRDGIEFLIVGVLSVDGKLYRFIGGDSLRVLPFVPLSNDSCGWKCKFSYLNPGANWEQPEYDDSAWKDGVGAFGAEEHSYDTYSLWSSNEIYVRRLFTVENLNSLSKHKLYVCYVCDDQIKLYLNGKSVLQRDTWSINPVYSQLSDSIISLLHNGDNLISAHGQNPYGAALLDVGLYVENDKYNDVDTATLKQMDMQVAQTKYVFQCGEVELLLDFVSPAFLDQSDIAMCPAGFITYQVRSKDNKQHDVNILFDLDTNWMSSKSKTKSKIDQDWRIVQSDSLYLGMIADETEYLMKDGHILISQKLCKKNEESGVLLLGYSEEQALQYEGENLSPFWNKKRDRRMKDLLKLIGKRHKTIKEECSDMDLKWKTKAFQTGSHRYAEYMFLSYRDFLATHRFVMDSSKQKLFCFGDTLGNIRESFRFFPTLLFFDRIDWMKGLLEPIFEYCENDFYTKRYPPYDIGLFPITGRQVGKENCSVEVAADILIMVAAIVDSEQSFDYANLHWDALCRWAEYLKDTMKGKSTFPCELLNGNDERVQAVLGWKTYEKLVQWKKEYE